MGDGLPRSVGFGAGLLSGPGRTGPNMERRNAMTLWNVAFRQTAFWDGRAASLEDQVHFPIVSAVELGRTMDAVVADVAAIPEYASLFAAAFPDSAAVSATTFAEAIATFERTLLSKRSLYDSFVAGDRRALTDSMLRGMHLLAKEGCTDCHRPPLFSSERFEDRGVAQVAGIEDDGRFEVTHDEADRGRFKVPTLRNAHDTAPYFHTGAIDTLDAAVAQEVAFSVAHDGAPPVDAAGVSDLVDFIREGLFDSGLSPARPHAVPSGLEVPLDGFALRR
jgi:cytochrome c peroxidase